MVQNIKPTRSELIKLKQQIKLSKSGYNLLKKKRDGLILDFFKIFSRAKNIRQELTDAYKDALEKINLARAAESDIALMSLALAVRNFPEITIQTKNIMGVVVPKIEFRHVQKQFAERGYGITSSSSKIDESVQAFEKVVELSVIAAEVETSMKKILVEIEKTKRRVNALEYKVIPEMDQQKVFIQFRLEEIERENIFRMK